MSRGRKGSLFNQFSSVINKSFSDGAKKKSFKNEHGRDMSYKCFSYADFLHTKERAKEFAHFVKATHPEIKDINQITNTHVTEYLNSKLNTCNMNSIRTYTSQLNKIGNMVEHYNHAKTFGNVPLPPNPHEKIRDLWADKKDVVALAEHVYNAPECAGKRAMQISLATGLRVSECVKLKGSNIDLENKCVHYIGKGGRENTTQIKGAYLDTMREYKEKYADTKIAPIKPNSANAYFHGKMRELGRDEPYNAHKTGFHAIRKEVAQEYYKDQLSQGKDIRDALNATSNNLGHGDYREDVDKCYTK